MPHDRYTLTEARLAKRRRADERVRQSVGGDR